MQFHTPRTWAQSRWQRWLPLLLLTSLAAAAWAQAANGDFSKLTTGWDRTLKQAQGRLQTAIEQGEADALRAQIIQVRTEAQEQGQIAQRKVDEISALLDALGPAPAAGAPEEAAEVRKKRTQMNDALADLTGQVKQCDLYARRSDAVLKDISAAQFERRTSNLLIQLPLPVAPATWADAARGLVSIMRQVHTKAVVNEGKANFVVLPLIAIGTFLAIFLGRLLRKSIRQRYGRDPSIPNPSYSRRLVAAVVDGIARGLIPVLVMVILLAATWWLLSGSVIDASVKPPHGLLYAIVFYLLVAALVRAAFSPNLPNWRIAPVSEESSAKIGRRLHLLVAVVAVGIAIHSFFQQVAEPDAVRSLHTLVINALVAGILFSLLRTKLWAIQSGTEWYEELPEMGVAAISTYLRLLIGVLTTAALGAAILGYVALSNYLLGNTILTLLMAGAMVALRFLSREAFWRLLSASGPRAQTLKAALALNEQGSRLIHSWILVAIDIVLVLSAILVGLIVWGIPPQDVADWIRGLFQGFNIGSYHFSFADLLLAMAMFAGIVIVTRLLQKFLEYRLLPNTRMDIGLRTAISSGVGYMGVAIAMLAAISVLGISLTGLAVVAGALSVGIGFGLQNIVNNFVSGIILLIERPVKIGDTVRVQDMEGIVKRIKVRSTEIETYQRASVIVPNAELLQGILLNLTHLDRTYRVEIPVGVGYTSDIDQVEALLLQCAKSHPRVLREPEPIVLLRNFGDNALEFELRIYLGELDDRIAVPSDIRKAVVSEFRNAGIEIPFPQRTVWIQPTAGQSPIKE